MATRLIRLADGTLVEAEVSQDQATQVFGGNAQDVAASFSMIEPVISNVGQAVSTAWSNLERQFQIDSVEVELNLAFEGEGNIFITRTKASSSISVKLVISRRTLNAESQ